MRILTFSLLLGLTIGAPAVSEVGLCDVCHLLVGEVQDLLTTKQTQHSISSYVNNACANLPSEEKDACNKFLTDHSGSLFNRLIKDLTPNEFCQSLANVCPINNGHSQKEQEEEDVNPSGNPLECELCKLAVLGIDKIIKQNRSSAAINDTLEKFCNDLPDQIKDVCIQIEPLILKGLTNGFEPDVVCKFATLCSLGSEEAVSQIPCDLCYTIMNSIGVTDSESICASQKSCIEESELQRKQESETKPEVEDTLECQICKFALQAVDVIVGENRSIAAINSTLENLCNSLPGELRDSCLNVEPDILKAILGGIDPTKACDFLKLCNDGGNVAISSQYIPCDVCKETLESMAGERGVSICYQFKEVCGYENTPIKEPVNIISAPKIDFTIDEEESENLKEDAKCEICKYIIQLLDEAVGTNDSINQVNNTLYQICSFLPDNIKSLCPLFIPSIEKALADGLDPTNTCIASNFCQKTESTFVSIEDLKCGVCAQFIETLPGVAAFKVKNGICNNVCLKRKRRSVDQESALLCQIKKGVEEAKAGLQGETECELCKIFIRTLDGLAGENTSIETVNKTVYEICTRLTGIQLQQMCLQSAPKLIVILKNGLDPEKTCISASFCSENEPEVKIQKRSVPEEKDFLLMKTIIEKERHNVGDLACDLCESVIEILDQLLEDNATDEKINRTLYNLCSGLPSGAFQDLCIKIVPTIMTAVDNGFNPQTICTDVGLCKERSKDRKRTPMKRKRVYEKNKIDTEESILLDTIVARQMKQENVGDLACDLCESVIEILDQLLEDNVTDEKINRTLYNLCSGLPSGAFQDLCIQIIPTIMSAVENGFDPQTVCTDAGLCTGKSEVRGRMSQKKKSKQDVSKNLLKSYAERGFKEQNLKDLKCEVCKAVIEELDTVVKQNTSIEKINETLYDVCNQLPGALQDLCLQAAPQIMNALKNGVDPSEACGSIGLCSSKNEGTNDETIEKEELDTNVEDAKCEICTLLVQGLDEILKGDASVKQINKTIYDLCSNLPGSAKSFCVMMAPAIVKQLQGGADPNTACAVLKLCAKEDEVKEEIANDNLGDIKCDICELIIREIDTIVGQNASAEKINATIYNLCNQLPGTAAKYCVLVAPTIVKAVESGVDPQSACTALKLCDSYEEVVQSPDNVGDIKCDICEFIIDELDAIVGQNASAEKINATIYNLCNQLPGTAAKYCIMVAPTIVKAIESGVDPQQACTALKLCSSSEQKVRRLEDVGDIKCDICELIIQELDTIVGQNSSADKINATIYNLCNQLPGTAAKYCILVAPSIVKEIEGGVDPKTACTDLKLCETSNIDLQEPHKNVEDIKCEICELAVHKLDELIGQNASKEKINSTMYQICNDLSGTAKIYCMLLAPAIVKEIEAGGDPTKTCKDIKLCTYNFNANVNLEVRKEPIDCGLCARSLKSVYDDLSSNYMKVKRTLLQICTSLPEIFQKPCENLVENDNGRIYKVMLQRYKPTSLCELANCRENETRGWSNHT